MPGKKLNDCEPRKYHVRNIHAIERWSETDGGSFPICTCGAQGEVGMAERQFFDTVVHIDRIDGNVTHTFIVQFETDPTDRDLHICCRICDMWRPFGGWGGTARYNPQFDRNRITNHVAECAGANPGE